MQPATGLSMVHVIDTGVRFQVATSPHRLSLPLTWALHRFIFPHHASYVYSCLFSLCPILPYGISLG